MSMIDKGLILRRFSSAAEGYDQAAVFQRYIAQELVALAKNQDVRPLSGEVLEVGCGTGLYSHELMSWLGNSSYLYTLNDLSPAIESQLREKVGATPRFIAGDAEELDWSSRHYTLITSSSAIQWWHTPLSFIQKASEALLPSGFLTYSTFLPDNLLQLRQATGQGLQYQSKEEHHLQLQASGFTEIHMEERRETLYFPSLIKLLQHLKQTGTNALRAQNEGPAWTASRLVTLEEQYRSIAQLAPHEPLPLTYVALLVTAHLPS
ncbi:MAG: methyltransferase domain-containing protein [Porphyromonas sp.]|nr:methyltransferase domain-containing protein [Porphyromonas sp.]